MSETTRLAFIGYGEAGSAFRSGWPDLGPDDVSAFDIKTLSPETRAELEARYAATNVRGCASPAEATAGATLVFSTVTADQALAAAGAAAKTRLDGALWLDCNSCAPDTKRQAAEAIEAAGGRYVDVAVMAPVHPRGHRVPLLLSGPHAGAAERALTALDMRPRIAGAEIGAASTIKMLRSVMVKGMEALSAECFLAARRAGVEDEVIASLDASDPGIDWRGRGGYALGRMMAHGTRRAAEMREVAATVAALGLPGTMSAAITDWQARIGALGEAEGEGEEADLAARADRLLARL